MSADGEITVAVRAEGTDEAAAELTDSGGGGGGGGGGDGEGGGLSQATRGGFIGGLLSEALGPVLDVLTPILNILSAFLAPLAALLLRLFAPVLRFLVRLLPQFISFVNDLPDIVASLPELIGQFLADLPAMIWEFIQQLPRLIWNAFTTALSWAADIGKAIADAIFAGAAWLKNGIVSIAQTIAEELAGLGVRILDDLTEGPIGDFVLGPPSDPAPLVEPDGNGGFERPESSSGDRAIEIIFEGGLSEYIKNAERNQNSSTGGS
jgi:AcrR family transcriptional regulator